MVSWQTLHTPSLVCQSSMFRWVKTAPFLFFKWYAETPINLCRCLNIWSFWNVYWAIKWRFWQLFKVFISGIEGIYDSMIGIPKVYKLYPTPWRSNSKHLPFQIWELVLIINHKWEAWFMGLTFPWARLPVASSIGILVVLTCCRGEKAAFTLHLTACSLHPAVSFSYYFFFIFKWKGWSCASVLHMEGWLLGWRRPFILPALSWFESSHTGNRY